MKILFLLGNLNTGGAEQTVAWLSSYLIQQGDEVCIAVFSKECDYKLDPKVRYIVAGIPSEGAHGIKALARTFRRHAFARGIVARQRPDVIFCITMDYGKYYRGKIAKKGARLIVSERSNPDWYDDRTRRMLAKIMDDCDGIVFQTKRIRERFLRYKDKSCVIPNAIGNPNVKALNWDFKPTKRIVAIGRLVKEKDYPVLMEAFVIFLSTHPGYTLEIYGDGIIREELKQEERRMGLSDSMKWMGKRTDALICAADADCYVLSSKIEGMPNALMEAMAIGMPCVATDCNYGPAELIRDGENGLLVPVGDKEALAAGISRMVDEPDFARICGKNAKKIKEELSVSAIGERYRTFIHQGKM